MTFLTTDLHSAVLEMLEGQNEGSYCSPSSNFFLVYLENGLRILVENNSTLKVIKKDVGVIHTQSLNQTAEVSVLARDIAEITMIFI